ncbi:UDP-glucose 4-epimerase [Treponema primitia ZAS-2]|uniref:UDP-glucose 4-epimerase n=1 Tax=Treponema primitia (strain ATCC BAA-887 / DSM 12427 / ZAS-2) TaxID=545694 RepID=F5YQA2_TREPZ|nr:NAD(P)-dependent oxidoreductase [Treponema primitia]AEF86093.1 UDP-glucose 4-epimerase [Treponema primitia ZAS-2]
MKVLITGAAGFVGSEFAKYLFQKNIDLVLIDNMEYGYKENLVIGDNGQELLSKLIIDDIRNPEIAKYFYGVDIVFHFAGISSLPECESNPDKAFEVNALGVINILNSMRDSHIKKFIMASTSALYENNHEEKMTEDLKVSPNLIYATTKLSAEQICRSYAENYEMDIFICRFFNVYGPHQDFKRLQPPFTSYLIREISAERTPIIFNTSDVKRDYIYIDDLMIYLEMIIYSKKHYCADIFNLCSSFGYSAMEIVNMIFDIFGKPVKVNTGNPIDFWNKYPGLFSAKYNLLRTRIEKEVYKNCIGSNNKIENEFNYTCQIGMKSGLKRIVDFQLKKY